MNPGAREEWNERLDAESARRGTDRHYRALHGVVEAHGGTVMSTRDVVQSSDESRFG